MLLQLADCGPASGLTGDDQRNVDLRSAQVHCCEMKAEKGWEKQTERKLDAGFSFPKVACDWLV